MDLFYVVSGAIEFTMREDPIHRARKRGLSEQSDGSLITESACSFNSKASLVRKAEDRAMASSPRSNLSKQENMNITPMSGCVSSREGDESIKIGQLDNPSDKNDPEIENIDLPSDD